MYRTESDLVFFHQCATSRKTPADKYYGCFSIEDSSVKFEAPPRRSTRTRKSP
jgi:hypothetical protein